VKKKVLLYLMTARKQKEGVFLWGGQGGGCKKFIRYFNIKENIGQDAVVCVCVFLYGCKGY
jgi:hypothetical protein